MTLGTATLQSGLGGLTLGNTIALAGAATVDTQANATTLSGLISGGGSLTKIGTGTLTLTAAETYTGATTVNAGTLAIGAGSSIAASSGLNLGAPGAAFDISNGGNQSLNDFVGAAGSQVLLGANTLTVNPTFVDTFAGIISGTGGLTMNGPGALTLSGSSTYSGGTAVNGGTLILANNSALGTGAVTLGNATLGSGLVGLSLGNAVSLTGAAAFDTRGNTATLTGIVSGTRKA